MTIEEKVANKALDADEVAMYYDEGCIDTFITTKYVHEILKGVSLELEKCNCDKCKKIIRRLGY